MNCYNDNGNSRMIMIMALIIVGREDSKEKSNLGKPEN